MNKTAIKNFAIWARVQLIESAKQRAYEYEITENGENRVDIQTIGDRVLSADEKKQREQLISEIRRKGYTQVIEEAAYTWFNRFVALRYMEVNGFLPSKVRVFTDENGAFKPEILKEAMTVEIDGLNRNKILDLLDKQNNEELYKYLLITQCNALNQGLPYMFEKISNWTELLFPANLLRSDSVIGQMVSEIPEEDWQDAVQIIGWLYQFYISEKHEEVVDPLHGKIIKKEDIPAATQLFTTDWVVRYILDNSLGRYWIERHPESQLADKLTYLTMPKNGTFVTIDEAINPDELKVFDPCVGSGHFLSYAFDILLEIYRECGWSDRDAAKSIIENNLYGLDIDDRAAQLACFSVAMKARKYNRRILNGESALNILSMQDSDFITEDFIHYFVNKNENLRRDINELKIIFNNAKEYGSTIFVPKLNFAALYERIDEIKQSFAEDFFQMEYQNTAIEKLLPLIKQAEILSHKYDIVATNPPYMNKYSPRLKDYINQHFADYKGDLFSVFMFRNFAFCKENGYSGFMTPSTWMAAKQHEVLREYIYTQKGICDFIQMAKGAFFKEATVDVCAFVLCNCKLKNKGRYIRLEKFKGDMILQGKKAYEAAQGIDTSFTYEVDCADFVQIPGKPMAYWISDIGLAAFKYDSVAKHAETKQGFKTGNNDLFLRLWHEINVDSLYLGIDKKDKKWFPCNKGGDYRKWYGNREYVVNWENGGYEIINYKDQSGKQLSRPQNINYNFRTGLSWSTLSSGPISFRHSDETMMFESKGSLCFVKGDSISIYQLHGYLNSKVTMYYLRVLAPTVDYSEGSIVKLPWICPSGKETIVLAKKSIELSMKDWDSFETSWDFKKHPLV